MKHSVKKAFCLLAAAALICSCGNNAKKEEVKAQEEAKKAAETMEKIASMPAEPVFEIVTTMGVIKVKLYSDTPKHRENFAKLAFENFYDGILFHRVIYGFMIQTGDPLTKDPANAPKFGTGGPGYTVPAEFVAEHNHKKGALAAARLGDMANPKRASSGSQFYIVQDERTCAQLDGAYTVFGEPLDGFEVIDKIASVQTDQRDKPVKEIKIITIKPVI